MCAPQTLSHRVTLQRLVRDHSDVAPLAHNKPTQETASADLPMDQEDPAALSKIARSSFLLSLSLRTAIPPLQHVLLPTSGDFSHDEHSNSFHLT
ncbi:hypothetical protein B0H11DRAFT_2213890 [Mycena galericulata]|nr:hypothetical protein B0H11DRAFT_2213890 [Mycena galericulata]